jgi:tetratricopeptide (TPR) repeat protein
MSLLIKALDHLEKNKQAEKDKKQTGEYVADEALSLELVPVDEKQDVLQKVEPSAVEAAKDAAVGLELHRGLSLEEEAGLISSSFVNSKYAKPETNVAKNTSRVTAPLSEARVTPQVEAKAPNVKSQAPRPTDATSSVLQNTPNELGQKAAAKVFVANKEAKAPSSKSTLFTMGVVGALLVWLGLQGYSYIKTLAVPEVAKPVLPIQSQVAGVPQAQVAALTSSESSVIVAPSNQEVQSKDNQPVNSGVSATELAKVNIAAFKEKTLRKPAEELIEPKTKEISAKKTANIASLDDGELTESSLEKNGNARRSPLALVTKAQSPGVDPTLLAAYQAYTRGDDVSAQQQYRQVLQRDVHNVDALLGMAAIAQRQGRDADAAGWYQKVLEVEPKNLIVLSANLNPHANNNDVISMESRIKNMLAQQPDGANLHEALGNLYAEQNQWPSAQEAYFNASRLAPNNADYAFNLAVSLDQMGKSSLALEHYERALELLNKSGGSSPDRAQLEARIRELQ